MKLFALLGLAVAGFLVAWPPKTQVDDFVVTEKMAYAVLPPEAIAPYGVKLIEWSPTGQYLLMVQETPKLNPGQAIDALLGRLEGKTQRSLLVWNKTTGKTLNLGILEAALGSDELGYSEYSHDPEGPTLPIRWFPGTDIGYVTDTRATAGDESSLSMRTEFRRIDLNRGTIANLPVTGVKEGFYHDFETDISPTVNKMVVVQTSIMREETGKDAPLTAKDVRNYIWTLDSQGQSSPPVFLGEGMVGVVGWLEGGTTVRLQQVNMERGANRVAKAVFFDVRENRVVQATNPKPYAPSSSLPPLEIRATPTETSAGTLKVVHRALWLSATGPSDRPAVMLSADADHAVLAPSLDRVAVLEKGVVTIRPLAAMNRTVWDEVARKEAMDKAKQVGLGLLMYGADYDDLLPSKEHFGEGVVDPYLKELGYRNQFTYLQNGGSLGDNKNPAGTPLGFVPGPGGYALVFADGHVEWRTGAPPAPGPESHLLSFFLFERFRGSG